MVLFYRIAVELSKDKRIYTNLLYLFCICFHIPISAKILLFPVFGCIMNMNRFFYFVHCSVKSGENDAYGSIFCMMNAYKEAVDFEFEISIPMD